MRGGDKIWGTHSRTIQAPTWCTLAPCPVWRCYVDETLHVSSHCLRLLRTSKYKQRCPNRAFKSCFQMKEDTSNLMRSKVLCRRLKMSSFGESWAKWQIWDGLWILGEFHHMELKNDDNDTGNIDKNNDPNHVEIPCLVSEIWIIFHQPRNSWQM